MHFYRPSKSNKVIKTEKRWVDDPGPHSAFGCVRRDGRGGSNGSKAVLVIVEHQCAEKNKIR